jgi:hypothetical protein
MGWIRDIGLLSVFHFVKAFTRMKLEVSSSDFETLIKNQIETWKHKNSPEVNPVL